MLKNLLFILLITLFSCSESSLHQITPLGAHSLVFHKKGYIVDVRAESRFSEVPDKAYIIPEKSILKNKKEWLEVYTSNKDKKLIFCCGKKDEFINLFPYIEKNKLDAFFIEDLQDWKNKGLHVDLPKNTVGTK